jgi:S-formylglutathione hydrolase
MSKLELISQARCFEGWQRTYQHASVACGCPMRFAVYLPPQADTGPVPAVYWLSGLTCTEDNFSTKAGAQQHAAALGLALIIPDTSPRGLDLPGEDERMELGTGAGFYVNATRSPWGNHYRMYDYVARELPELVPRHLPVDGSRKSISGHSMGGHGALTVGLKNPDNYRSISAFAPICAPTHSGWGRSAFTHYLGEDEQQWQQYDASYLAAHQPCRHELLIDQGSADPYLDELRPDDLRSACAASGQPLKFRERAGYEHGYYFVTTFIGEHLSFHAAHLK